MNFNEIDNLIKIGQAAKALKVLRPYVLQPRPRSQKNDLLNAARLCRRSGWPEGGLRLLNRYVRPSLSKVTSASPEEKIEYAASLIALGLISEGRELLSQIKSKEQSSHFLTLGVSYFSEWDYASAIPYLRNYVSAKGINDYQRLIGQVNLLAALVMIREFDEAFALLENLKVQCESEKNFLLLGNLFEIETQAHVQIKNYKKAHECIVRSEDLLSQHTNIDKTFTLKWKAIVAALNKGWSRSTQAQLLQVKKLAMQKNHWETIRDCDFYICKFSKKAPSHLYFGTPYKAYRERIESELNYTPAGPYIWKQNAHAHPTIFDPNQSSKIKPGQKFFNLLKALASDFYRPHTVFTLFAQLNPGEYYNPISSPASVHQILKRFRQWCEKENLPMRIQEVRSNYNLIFAKDFALKISEQSESGQMTSSEIMKYRFRKGYADSVFSRKNLEEALNLSPRACNLLIAQWLEQKLIKKEGQARSTIYHWL